MSGEHVVYLDSSAIVKLVVAERESAALRAYIRRRAPLVSSALARTEVLRAVLPYGAAGAQRAVVALGLLELIRLSDRVLAAAGSLMPAELRSLDAIHLATVELLGTSVSRVVSYDDRLTEAAVALGHKVVAPS